MSDQVTEAMKSNAGPYIAAGVIMCCCLVCCVGFFLWRRRRKEMDTEGMTPYEKWMANEEAKEATGNPMFFANASENGANVAVMNA